MAAATKKKRVPPRELGTTGIQQYSGVVREEWLPELQGTKGARVYQKMRDESPIIGACFGTISALLKQTSLSADPYNGSSDAEDVKRSTFVNECLNDLKRGQSGTIGSLLSMLEHGWSIHEPLYRVRSGYHRDPDMSSRFNDGMIGWTDWAPRLQRTLHRWEFKENGTATAMWQVAPPRYQPTSLPFDRMLHLVADSSNPSPESRSCLRNAYDPWFAAREIQYLERIGIARDLVGIPVAELPSDLMDPAAADDKKAIRAQYEEMITSLYRNEHEGIVWCSDRDEKGNPLYVLRLLATGGTRQFDTTKIIERLERRIAMALLSDWIFLGHQAEGSHALADNRTTMFAAAIGGWLRILVEGIQTQLLPQLFEVNGMATHNLPCVKYSDIELPDLGKIGDYMVKLYSAGMDWDFEDPTLQRHLRSIANLPQRAENATRVGSNPDAPGDPPADPGRQPRKRIGTAPPAEKEAA